MGRSCLGYIWQSIHIRLVLFVSHCPRLPSHEGTVTGLDIFTKNYQRCTYKCVFEVRFSIAFLHSVSLMDYDEFSGALCRLKLCDFVVPNRACKLASKNAEIFSKTFSN